MKPDSKERDHAESLRAETEESDLTDADRDQGQSQHERLRLPLQGTRKRGTKMLHKEHIREDEWQDGQPDGGDYDLAELLLIEATLNSASGTLLWRRMDAVLSIVPDIVHPFD